jgi:hypothetical protein
MFFFKQYFIHIQSEWFQAAGLAYFSPLPTLKVKCEDFFLFFLFFFFKLVNSLDN